MTHLIENKTTAKGYAYLVHLLWNRFPQVVKVAHDGVTIFWENDRVTRSNIAPGRIFDGDGLTHPQIGHIVNLLEATGFEGCDVEVNGDSTVQSKA